MRNKHERNYVACACYAALTTLELLNGSQNTRMNIMMEKLASIAKIIALFFSRFLAIQDCVL